MKTTNFYLFFFLCVFNSANIYAGIVCHTPRMNKIFKISSEDQKITFFQEYELTNKRAIASIDSYEKLTSTKITKITNFENQKHIIHIENTDQFSDANDYIIIKSAKGHEVTYPLLCKND